MRGMSQWRGIELVELNRKCSNVIETFLKALHTHTFREIERERNLFACGKGKQYSINILSRP